MSTAHQPGRRLPVPAAWPVRSSSATHRWAIISAGLAPILLTGAYLIAGILQLASCSPMRATISAMAGQAGTDRWVMTGGIFLVGGCYLVTAAGLTGVRASARALLAVAGLAERLTTSIQTRRPFIIAVALRRARRPRPGLAIGGSSGAKDGPPRGPGPAGRGRRPLPGGPRLLARKITGIG